MICALSTFSEQTCCKVYFEDKKFLCYSPFSQLALLQVKGANCVWAKAMNAQRNECSYKEKECLCTENTLLHPKTLSVLSNESEQNNYKIGKSPCEEMKDQDNLAEWYCVVIFSQKSRYSVM